MPGLSLFSAQFEYLALHIMNQVLLNFPWNCWLMLFMLSFLALIYIYIYIYIYIRVYSSSICGQSAQYL